MANILATLNTKTAWVVAGTSDTATCPIQDEDNKEGIEVVLTGGVLDGATATIYSKTGATKVLTFATGTGSIGLVGEKFRISKLVVSNLAAATYSIEFGR